MYFEYQNLVTKTNVNQPTQTEVKPHGLVTCEAMSLISLGFVIGWAGLFLTLSKMRTVALDKINVNTKSLHKIRCKKCQFFSNNRYLKCAVQPGIVLTKEAENCPDYCPSNDKFRH
ncbi:MAG: hypothetical protein DSM106950_18315 [Stigonema ocellatum SAG 48.90 = DSM 106950]|nr:hypothetical protein [Stigonema ocellatum SAG 48.90 = DSM 106950]